LWLQRMREAGAIAEWANSLEMLRAKLEAVEAPIKS